MHLLIDMQGDQTASRYRGIGRYTRSLVRQLIHFGNGHHITLLFNEAFPESVNLWREDPVGHHDHVRIRTWSPPGPVSQQNPENAKRAALAASLHEQVMAAERPDVILVTSLFEDETVIGLGEGIDGIPRAIMLYDLIPLVHSAEYLKPSPNFEQFYRRSLRELSRADLLLAISEHSAFEAESLLGIAGERIAVIGTDADAHFRPLSPGDPSRVDPVADLALPESFIFYTGGVDPRKNLDVLLRAYRALPEILQQRCPLVCAGRLIPLEAEALRRKAREIGIPDDRLRLLGHVDEDTLVSLYNLCTVYVFPSRHEGFGLPALEAMRCGAPVLAANRTSLPEVLNDPSALFDPDDPVDLGNRLQRVLSEPGLREQLARRGAVAAQRFSWQKTGCAALAALEDLAHGSGRESSVQTEKQFGQRHRSEGEGDRSDPRPTLAYVSPIPPARSGIADYSAELVKALAEYYRIILVADQVEVDPALSERFGSPQSPSWLASGPEEVDRVLYHVGNSHFHPYMVDLLATVPGTVMLHDFYLSGMLLYHGDAFSEPLDGAGQGQAWAQAARLSHGYAPLQQASKYEPDALIAAWPCNWPVIQRAEGVIVHSHHAVALATRWYRPEIADEWRVIPLLRQLPEDVDRQLIRKRLGLSKSAFLVCCFGLIAPTKRNHELLEAWKDSALATDPNAHLVFVGENHPGEYGKTIERLQQDDPAFARVHITGWADPNAFQDYLAVTDVAVQLRGESRGETSGAVLDAMAHGLPVIVNAHGSMAELDPKTVYQLPDPVPVPALSEALELLHRDPAQRLVLGQRARSWIAEHHDPRQCAKAYAAAIEADYEQARRGQQGLVDRLRRSFPEGLLPGDRRRLARAIDRSLPTPRSRPRLYVDVTATAATARLTGIERVARHLMHEWIMHPPTGVIVEPVRLVHGASGWHYRSASALAASVMSLTDVPVGDEMIELQPGDRLLIADISGHRLVEAASSGLFDRIRAHGALVHAIVYDLLPLTHPECFPPQADQMHRDWLMVLSRFDGLVAISRAVADSLSGWLEAHLPSRGTRPQVDWFHLGADNENHRSIKGDGRAPGLPDWPEGPTWLMVGTIEPRKGHAQALDAFDWLLAQDQSVNLVIVGNEGWKSLPDSQRRGLPALVRRMRNHPALNQRLFWFEGLDDQALTEAYRRADWLLAASVDEGFGLPLIEAARHGRPVLARDIPVFREVAPAGTRFFDTIEGPELAREMEAAFAAGPPELIGSGVLPSVPTWEESARQLWGALTASRR